jgi:hypothetical protein
MVLTRADDKKVQRRTALVICRECWGSLDEEL